jgi:hypothetical protein
MWKCGRKDCRSQASLCWATLSGRQHHLIKPLIKLESVKPAAFQREVDGSLWTSLAPVASMLYRGLGLGEPGCRTVLALHVLKFGLLLERRFWVVPNGSLHYRYRYVYSSGFSHIKQMFSLPESTLD